MNIEIKGVSDQDKERVEGKVAAVNEALEELRSILEGTKCDHDKSECESSKDEPTTKVLIELKHGSVVKVYRMGSEIVLACLDKDDDKTRCVLTDDEARSLGNLLLNVVREEEPIQ